MVKPLWHLADGQLRDRETGFATAHDWVCGMEIIIERAAGTRERYGSAYYFCSQLCVDKYDSHPNLYASG